MATQTDKQATEHAGRHDRWLKSQLEDPEFREVFERERREIAIIDEIVNALDHRRDELGLSKADVARLIGKNAASVRRLLTAPGNPELRTVVAIAEALDVDVKLVPRKRRRVRAGSKPPIGVG
jgi:DNA-binding phage protein